MTRLIFFVFIILAACHSQQEQNIDNIAYSAYLKPLNQDIVIPLDSITSNITSNCSYFNSGNKELILYLNNETNDLLLFDVPNRKLYKKIHLQKDGPEAISNPQSVQMFSPDSILILSAYIKILNLLNEAGKLVSRFDLQKDIPKADEWLSEPMPGFCLLGNNCIFETFPSGNERINPGRYYKEPIGAVFDLKKKVLTYNLFHYPPVYNTGDYYGMYQTYQYITSDNKSKIIISFPLSPNIYVTDLKGVKVTHFQASSQYFNEPIKPYKYAISEADHYFHQNAYRRILYDAYRKVYYRFASVGVEGKVPQKMIDPTIYKPTSVIILNEKFEKIGETKLPKDTYYTWNAFVSKKGLCISNSHPNNYKYKENELRFSCLQLMYY